MKINTISFNEYIMDVKNALFLQSFDQYRSADQFPYLESVRQTFFFFFEIVIFYQKSIYTLINTRSGERDPE